MFTGIRLMQVAATLAILAALAAGCGGDSGSEATQTTMETQTTETDTTTETTPPTATEEEHPGPTVVQVTVVNGAPKGGIVRETVEQDDLAGRAEAMGSRLVDGLRDVGRRVGVITEVRGKGLLVGAELDLEPSRELRSEPQPYGPAGGHVT